MTAHTARRLGWGIWILSIGSILSVFAYALFGPPTNQLSSQAGATDAISTVAFISAFATVGALVASRRPENPIGWLLSFTGLCYAIATVSLFIALQPWGERLAAWMGNWIWGLGVAFPITFVPLLFPDGHLPSRRWRPVAWLAGIGIGIFIIGSVFAPGVLDESEPPIVNPLGFGGAIGRAVFGTMRPAGLFLCLLMVPLVLASLVFRYRRADGTEREQLRWLIFAGVFVGLGIVSSSLVGRFVSNPNLATDISNAMVSVAATAIPIAIGIAILKYRLYDIDVVISKTLVYGSLAVLITVVYVGIVAGIGSLIHTSLALSVAATAVVALVFQPARDRLQRWANRLVYGDRATPYEVLARFSERIADTYATEDVLPRTARVIAEGTGAERAEVWLRVEDHVRRSAVWPDQGSQPLLRALVDGRLPAFDGVDRTVPVTYRDELLGCVTVTKRRGEALTPTEGSLLDDLAHQAGLVLSNVRLTAELEARLERITEQATALQASRQRIVAAQDTERRRLERNIHDGAQQHLVALAVKLRLSRVLLAKDAVKAGSMLVQLRDQVDEALDTLRALALGIYPPLLEERGIAAAIAAQYVRSDLPVQMHTDGTGRYPIDTEAAIYFCVLEALQNAAKYAHASAIDVRLTESHGVLGFEVVDDGVGFVTNGGIAGTGLAGMRDRLAVLGGDADVWSEPGRGTRVQGRVPVGGLSEVRA